MVSYTFTHEGRPHVKERPRSGPNSKRLYTPKRTLDYEKEIASSYEGPFFEGPIDIILTFLPKSTICTIRDWTGAVSPLRGDIDNYIKLMMDGLEGKAFTNDKQVMAISAAKGA